MVLVCVTLKAAHLVSAFPVTCLTETRIPKMEIPYLSKIFTRGNPLNRKQMQEVCNRHPRGILGTESGYEPNFFRLIRSGRL